MGIYEKLNAIRTAKADICQAILNKDPSVPPTDDIRQWPTAIASITKGGEKYGISSVTQILGTVTDGNLSISAEPFDYVASGVVTYDNGAFNRLFAYNNNIRSATFPDLITIDTYNMDYTFSNCENLTSVTFTKLESILNVQYAFRSLCQNCTNLQSINFPALKIIRADGLASAPYTFSQIAGGTSIRSLNFPELQTIYGKTGTSGVVTSVFGNAFGASEAGTFYFPKVTSINNIVFANVAHTVHFAANNRTAIESSTGYNYRFGLNANAQILFDL